MVILHYPYLLLKMPGPNGVLSLRGDLKRAFDCDVQAVQIVAKAQATSKREEIATVAAEINVKQIDLETGDPSKTATINAHFSTK
jgi:hypothetical protein